MQFRNSAIWIYRQMTARSRRRLLEQLRQQKQMPVAVLFYHRVSDRDPTQWTISVSDFKRHLDWLQENFDLVSLGEAQKRIRAVNNERFSVAITFDDGYAENCQNAIPELIQRKIPLTYFVATDFIGRQRSFRHDIESGITPATNSWDELRDLAKLGVEFGAHTKTHCNVARINNATELEDEVWGSVEQVKRQLGSTCRYFAFPYGRPENMSQAAVSLLHERGIEGICSAYGALNWPGQNGFHIRRIHGDPGLERLKNWLTLDNRHLVDQYQLPFTEPSETACTEDTVKL